MGDPDERPAWDPDERIDPVWVSDCVPTRLRLEAHGDHPELWARLLSFTITVPDGLAPAGIGPLRLHVAIPEEHWPAIWDAIAPSPPTRP